jgi:hypothetical protein
MPRERALPADMRIQEADWSTKSIEFIFFVSVIA